VSKNVKIRTYKAIILPVILQGCKTWFLILREKQKLRVFENRVVRRWRDGENCKMRFITLYFLPSIIGMVKLRNIRSEGPAIRMGERRNAGY
jgi:hypothetical protein